MVKEHKITEMHTRLLNWRSCLQFIGDEMTFIEKLLNSYVFEPRTPNLFERLELFKRGFKASKKEKEILLTTIKEHEKHLGGLVECTTEECDESFHEKHRNLEATMHHYLEDYLKLKGEVYNYAGSVLKRKKPLH